jgi:tetratricopeptide (TPR) repeat protein
VYRPLEEPLKSSLKKIHRYPNAEKIQLESLTPEESVELINSRLDIPDLPENFKELVLQKSQGNPFYVEELIQAMKDSDVLEYDKERGHYVIVDDLEKVELPDSLQSLIMSRIDRLDEQSKMTLKIASVIGRIFRMSMLKGVYPTHININTLRKHLSRLDGREFTHLDKPAPELEYLFKHIMTKEVAYESLLFAHRRELHEKTAEFIEEIFKDEVEDYTYVLAYHYGLTNNTKKKIDYFEKAGNKAKKTYDNDNAVYFYTKALENLEDKKDKVSKKMEVLENRAEVFKLKGKYDEGIEDYDNLLELATDSNNLIKEIVAEKRKGGLLIWSGKKEGKEILFEALEKAKKHKLKDQEADCLNNIGVAYHFEGNLEKAYDFYKKSLATYKESDDKIGIARALTNKGGMESLLAKYDDSLQSLKKAKEIYEEISDKRNMAISELNMADVYSAKGEMDEALKYYEEALKIAQQIGAKADELLVLGQIGRVYNSLGDYEKSIENCEKANDIAIYELQNQLDILYLSFNLAFPYFYLNNFSNSLSNLQTALDAAQRLNDNAMQTFIHRWMGYTYQKSGDMETAKEHYDTAIQIAEEIESPADIANAENFVGFWHQEKAEFEQAKEWHNKAYGKIDHVEDDEEKMYIYLGMASCLRKMGDKTSLEYARKAFDIAPQNDKYNVMLINIELARCLLLNEQKEEAKDAYQNGIAIIHEIEEKLSEENRERFLSDKKQVFMEYEGL